MLEQCRIQFYRGRVAVNLLAKDLDNAVEAVGALDGNGLVGVISKDFPTVDAAVRTVEAYLEKIPAVSVGLGAGDPRQWEAVAEIAARTDPGHANQTFTGAMYTRGLLAGAGRVRTVVNCLISPTGVPGQVKISTGPYSSAAPDAVVDARTAVAMMKDLGLRSVKYFNLRGLKHLEELRVLAKACVEAGIPVFEPTGGLGPENVREVVKACLGAGCERVIPHVYSSIIDPQTGLTDVGLVRRVYSEIKQAF